jgi:hypothetical protein
MSTCVWQRYDAQYCLQREFRLNAKKKTGHHQEFQSTRKQENNSRIPYEYKVGDQV